MTVVSAGLIVRTPTQMLLAHATYTPRWDIPKGGIEENESPLDAALRECWEETNLDFKTQKEAIIDLGEQVYIKGKNLHLFTLDLPEALPLNSCKCHTFVEKNGHKYPETDRWEWFVFEEVLNKVGKGLGNLLIETKIVPNPGPNWWNERVKAEKMQLKRNKIM